MGWPGEACGGSIFGLKRPDFRLGVGVAGGRMLVGEGAGMKKTVLITGASTGIGEAAARRFALAGWNVAATMRVPGKSALAGETIACIPLDVTDEISIRSAIDATITRFGRIDVVVNNAGYAVCGPFEGATTEQIERQFETNVFGLMSVTRAVLPHFREQRGGTIVNVSSIGGLLTFPLFSLYHATKWAVEGFSEGLHYEVEPFGIRVKLVEPGAVNTDFYNRSMDVSSSPPYDAMMKIGKPKLDAAGRGGVTPERVAETIFRAANDGRARLRYPVNAGLLALRKFVPESLYFALIKRAILR